MLDGFGGGQVGGGVGEAVEEFYLAFRQFFAYGDAVGDAGEVGVFELDAGAFVAVVEQDVEACGGEVGGKFFGGFDERLLLDVGDGDDDLEGCDGGGQGVGFATVFSGAGFNCGGEDALNADAVGAHDGGDFLAVAVEDGSSH